MSDSNEILAKKIEEKLKAEGFIIDTDKKLVAELAKGNLKDYDWKVALEEVINKKNEEDIANNETE